MYCWNCGHNNADDNKFCGECGKTLLVPEVPPTRRSTGIGSINIPRPDTESSKEPPKRDVSTVKVSADQSESSTINDASKTAAGIHPAETSPILRTTTKLTNPLVEEPRVVRETLSPMPPAPVAVEASASRPTEEQRTVREGLSPLRSTALAQDFPQARRFPETRVTSSGVSAVALSANRIAGPSFLGLSDEPRLPDDSSYLLDDEESSSSWRGYLALAFLLIFGVLVVRQWTEMRGIASDFAQRLGIADVPKKVKAQPTVSSSENQPGQSSSQGTNTSSDNVNPTATPNANSANPPPEVAKAKPTESLAGGKPENEAASGDTAKPAKGKAKGESKSANKNEEDADAAPAEPAKTSAKSTKASAAAAPPTYDNSQVDLAQRYLQGKGVRQDCNRGVSLLRSAARQANPKARIQMAALYLSGHCVEQNLPQAYSWFAQAQELEPNNSWIERNLNSLWSKMTDEERRRVLR
jgi:hypothetical protein